VVVSPVFPVVGKMRQEDWEFKASLGNITRPYFKTKTKLQKKEKEKELDMVAYAYSPSYLASWEVVIRKVMIRGQPGQKLTRPDLSQ
jgi:hypothetical protein